MISDVAAALAQTDTSPAASRVNQVLGYTAATRIGASGVATHTQRDQTARAANPQAPAVAMSMKTSMVRPAPEDQSSAYCTCLPLIFHSMTGSTSSRARIGGATMPPWQNIRRSCGIAFVFRQSARKLGMCVFRTPNVGAKPPAAVGRRAGEADDKHARPRRPGGTP